MSDIRNNITECDVLVIGGGLAGCWAAMKAREITDKVVLVDKGRVGSNGSSVIAGASVCCPTEEEDLLLWMKEIVDRGEYLNDQDWIPILLQEQIKRIKELDSWGVPVPKDGKGNYIRVVSPGREHIRTVSIDSVKLMQILRQRALEQGVIIHDGMMITELLSADGKQPTNSRIAGAVGFTIHTGEARIYKAKATILATGLAGQLNITGDGIAQAFRSGAEITGIEFARLWSGWVVFKKYFALHPSIFLLAPSVLANREGEKFMEQYPRRYKIEDLAAAIVREGVGGKGPLQANMSSFPSEGLKKLRQLTIHDARMRALEREGINITQQRLELNLYSGNMSLESNCGVRNNIYCETNLAGLYVAGQIGGYPAIGTYSMLSNLATAMCCVTGYRAGEYAAKFALENSILEIDTDQAKAFLDSSLQPLRCKGGLSIDELKNMVQEALSPAEICLFKHKETINKVLSLMKEWNRLLDRLEAKDVHELVKVNGFKNHMQCLELSFISGLVREESRGIHLRADFPYRDDINWLKWIVLRKEDRGLTMSFIPVPIYRYPIKPPSFEKLPFPIPMPVVKEDA